MSRVTRNTPINEVIRVIVEGGLRTVAVVSPEDILIGVITEGDIVRAFARGMGPALLAEDVMNVAPHFVSEPVENADLAHDFLEHGHLAVPVVDAKGRFLHLVSTAEAVRQILGFQWR